MARKTCLRVGRLTVYLRGRTWYLRYYENGRRRQVRATTDRESSRQLAAQVNAQLEIGAPAATNFEPITIPELRKRWLDHHEHVLRSSLATIDRYRSATDHLLNFVKDVQPLKQVAHLRASHAEAFVRYLRQLQVAPNGHRNTAKRHLRDKGIRFVLEVSRTLFGFAIKRRHLPPYSENPFTTIQVDRIPVEDAKAITMLTAEQERALMEQCDDWQLPIFATLLLTGVRPGELTHLLLPRDLDLEAGLLHVVNKPELGWQVKTRNERTVPLVPELIQVLKLMIGNRNTGPVFQRRRHSERHSCALSKLTPEQLREELDRRSAAQSSQPSMRHAQRKAARRLWVEIGVLPEARLRLEFIKQTKTIGLPNLTAPKTLRHMFATGLLESNVDPLIRNLLMGHVPMGDGRGKGPLGMTAVYSHASPQIIRHQLEEATKRRPAREVLRKWLSARSQPALA